MMTFADTNAKPHYNPDLLLEPIKMVLRLHIDIEKREVKGSNTITLRANQNGNHIQLNAVDFTELEVIDLNGNWSYDDKVLDIRFSQDILRGETIDIKINYRVTNPVGGLYFSFPDTIYPNRGEYVISDHESERARYWIPCIDLPIVRTKLEWILTSNEKYIILANGNKISDTIENGFKTTHWIHDFPCPSYLAVIAIGKFSEYIDEDTDAGKGKIPVAYYCPDNISSSILKTTFDNTPSMIKWYINKFNMSMEWTKYYQIAVPKTSGAMENQTLVTWDSLILTDEEYKKDIGYIVDSVNVHEMAHTFFGDQVVIKDFSHGWLKESWATYVSALYLEDHKSSDEFDYSMYLNAQRYFDEVKNRYTRPIVTRKYESSWQMFDSHLYPGGAWRIHMLRKMIGESMFWTAIHDYLRTYNEKVVQTNDFREMLEKHSGLNLEKFFDQWLFEPMGYPIFKLNFIYESEKNNGKLTIIQEQLKNDNLPFHVSVEIAWFVNKTKYSKTVDIVDKLTVVEISAETKPDYIRIDPDNKLLYDIIYEPSFKEMVSQLKESDVIGRIQAAKFLIATGKKNAFEEIKNFITREEFFGVRSEVAEILGKSQSPYAIKILIEMLSIEVNPRVISSILIAMGQYQNISIETVLLNYITHAPTPLTRSNTLISIGKQRNSKNTDFLKKYTEYNDFNDITKRGAYNALGENRDLTVIDFLIDKSIYGVESEIVRKFVMVALGNLGKWSEKLEQQKTLDQLLINLQEDDYRVRQFIYPIVAGYYDNRVIPALKSLCGRHPFQEQVSIKKSILSVGTSSSSEINKLQTKIEEIQNKLMSLEEKIQSTNSK